MARNDPAFVKPYFHVQPWHQIEGIMQGNDAGSYLFFAGIKRAAEWDYLKNKPGKPVTIEWARANAGGNEHLAKLMLFTTDDNQLGVCVMTSGGPKIAYTKVAHVRALGSLEAFVGDLQVNHMPVDITKGVRYVNMYDVFDPGDGY